MFLFDEKRKPGYRRIRDECPPSSIRERRTVADRRQTDISEITLHEWTRHFLKYQERIVAKSEPHRAANSTEVTIRTRA